VRHRREFSACELGPLASHALRGSLRSHYLEAREIGAVARRIASEEDETSDCRMGTNVEVGEG